MTIQVVRAAPQRRLTPSAAGTQVFLVVLTLAFLAPVVWALVSAFKPANLIVGDPLGFDPSTVTLENFRKMFADVPIGQGFLNTAVILVVKGTLTLLLAPLAAYGFAKYSFRFKDALFGTVLLTLMLPTVVLIIPLLLQMKELGWVNT